MCQTINKLLLMPRRLAIRIQGRGPIFVDFVSLFPEVNGPAGSKTPFRQDLLQLLKDLHPK